MVVGFQSFIYLLCFAASCVCATLLVRSYMVNKTRLLLWVAVCFVLLAFNNLFVICDVLFFPDVNYLPFRQAASLGAIIVLLFGFVWDAD